jgi:hypothetical protein
MTYLPTQINKELNVRTKKKGTSSKGTHAPSHIQQVTRRDGIQIGALM